MTLSLNNFGGENSPFDAIRRFDDNGNEFWSARELMPLLGYTKWQKFNSVIEIAKENLEIVVKSTLDHFLPILAITPY
ncbi:MAG: hypothetical protein DDT26_00763 [Dehalococcoidia bacterium]|nr:hypothetical protein [Chloroflexota bacterium]